MPPRNKTPSPKPSSGAGRKGAARSRPGPRRGPGPSKEDTSASPGAARSRPGPRREVGPIRGDAGAGAGALSLYAPSALGLSGLLGEELRGLGASGVRVELSGVAFQGDLGLAYRACLWSRLASRVLLQL
ncbi:MAG: hypothetical protein RBU30_23845, partial [Polyangia bacterium]|nr:hypothetical protein [Polyangia bacterium]